MKKLLLILPLIILMSCVVQKRKYQKGFYVSNPKHHLNLQKTTSNNSKKEIEAQPTNFNVNNLSLNTIKELELSASIENKVPFFSKSPSTIISQTNDSLCDIVILKNGDEVKATVLELTPALVKYKRCDDAESPLYIVKKTDVFKIKYANGAVELFNEETKKPIQNNDESKIKNDYNGALKTHPLAIWAFVYSILGLVPFLGLFTSIRAIFYGTKALKIIKANPTEYKGDMLATTAIVLGIIGLVLLLLLLFALFAV